MMLLAAFPGWESLHPLIVHFPIALLIVAPLFVLIGAVLSPSKGRPYLFSAVILMGLGTAALWIAMETGEAAAEVLPKTAGAQELLSRHQNLATEARGLFVMLLVLFVLILLTPKAVRQDGRLYSTVLPLCFLVLYSAGAVVLVRAAHQGGELVHNPEMHANTPISPQDGRSALLAEH